jgi:tripeptidyl-peptidase I
VSGSAQNGNHVAITSYLGQYANIADLQAFYEDQRPDAVNSSFHFVSVDGTYIQLPLLLSSLELTIALLGGLNSQNASEAGGEANLDTQFAFGLTFPTPATLYSTGRQPPFVPDPNAGETNNTNEPYANVR